MALGESESQGNGDSSAQLRKEARGRTAKRISRLEHTLGETQAQLERSRSKRDELEHLLQQMVDTESTRQDDLRAREQELERQRVEHQTLRQELEQRVAAAERERAAAQRREQQLREELESAHAELGQRERQARGKLESARSELEHNLAELGIVDPVGARRTRAS